MKPRNLKAVFFDLDGTLVDTADEFISAVQALREEHGHGPMDEARIRASVSNGARALVKLSLGFTDDHPALEDQWLRLLELYTQVLGTTAKPYPGIESLLQELAARGIRWGIATNKPRAYAQPLMDALNLQPPFSSLVCPDDVNDRKPHPESLYRNCLDAGCAPHEAIYVGDHLRDIEAGRSAGMHTIAAAYGYIEPGDDANSWGADTLATCSTQLSRLILDS